MMIALAIHTTTLVFQLKTANLLVIARYMYTYSTLLTTHNNRIHVTCTAIASLYTYKRVRILVHVTVHSILTCNYSILIMLR